jgi:hypothetical protein
MNSSSEEADIAAAMPTTAPHGPSEKTWASIARVPVADKQRTLATRVSFSAPLFVRDTTPLTSVGRSSLGAAVRGSGRCAGYFSCCPASCFTPASYAKA